MTEPSMHFIDGYHGGVRGAAPIGALRDILEALDRDPGWAVTLDLEPATWDLLVRREPAAYRAAMARIGRRDGRLVLGNAFLSQPYLQFFHGESGLRQLRMGLAMLRRHAPDADLSAYAPQEPCWATYLPTLLAAFGIRLVCLKDPGTAFSGWMHGVDAHLVRWIGPDGTAVEAVPRYACEGFVRAFETESRYATAEFAQRCRRRGIAAPVGTGLQDFGWPARRAVPFKQPPGADMSHVAFATWQEWRRQVPPPARDWRIGIDDIVPTLPFGDWLLHRLAGAVRAAENSVLAAERLSAAAWLIADAPWPAEILARAWTDLAWAQHHDAWICPDSALAFRPGEPPWGESGRHEARAALHAAQELVYAAATALTRPAEPAVVALVNQAGVPRDDLAVCDLDLGPGEGVRATLIVDGEERGRLPAQIVANPEYGMFDAWHHRHARTVLVRCPLPALGIAAVRIETAAAEAAPETGCTAVRRVDGRVELAGGGIRLVLDPARGGVCTDAVAGVLGALDRTDAPGWLTLRGFDPAAGRWLSSADQPAEVAIVETGPLRAAVDITGAIGACRFRMRVAVDDRGDAIDVDLHLLARQPQPFGDPHGGPHGGDGDGGVGELARERHAAWHDDGFKLQLLLPLPQAFAAIDKASAYDVCRSPAGATRFRSWDEARHRAILHWLDLRDEAGDRGLGILVDRVVAYESDGAGRFGLVVGWGRDGRALHGQARMRLRLVPHAGDWRAAGIWHRYERFCAGSIALPGREPLRTSPWLHADGLIPTLEVDGDALVLRAWNPGATGEHRLAVAGAAGWRAEDLAGNPTGQAGDGDAWTAHQAAFGIAQWRLRR